MPNFYLVTEIKLTSFPGSNLYSTSTFLPSLYVLPPLCILPSLYMLPSLCVLPSLCASSIYFLSMLPSKRGGREGRRERESKNKQTYLLCFLKKREREREQKKERERAEEGERGARFPLCKHL
jgi:hypothetical protein